MRCFCVVGSMCRMFVRENSLMNDTSTNIVNTFNHGVADQKRVVNAVGEEIHVACS